MATAARMDEKRIEEAYALARERYAAFGVDADAALDLAAAIPVSVHCWQADDVVGLEAIEAAAGGGIMATGNYPGRARTGDELRADYEEVFRLAPGLHRLNLHASYAETGGARVDRDALTTDHFAHWIDWAQQAGIHLDFNSTFFAHPKADDGFTLSHADAGIRAFWIAHALACRRIAQNMAARQGDPCILNHWIPDGLKDSPADRWGPRARLVDSLDKILSDNQPIDRSLCIDAVESKLFGLGSEDYVVGSAEFYSNYALSRGVVYCLDMGHFHPTETIHDKMSAYLQFHPKLLLHVSRPLRWDSDHVVIFNDDLRSLFQEVARGAAWDRVYVAMDFFDASINRIGAYVIGARAARKAILNALLDPTAMLQQYETEGKGAQKLALMEEMRAMPFDAVWNRLCLQEDSPPGFDWVAEIEAYEKAVLSRRG
jgi:L-rhamnose isomerase